MVIIKNKQTKVNIALLTILLLVVPFLHLGFSYYLSSQMLGVSAMVLLIMTMGIQPRAALLAAMGTALFLIKAFMVMRSYDSHEIALVIREMCCFMLLLLSIQQVSYLGRPDVLLKQYKIFLYMCVAIVSLQYIAILSGFFIQFPFDWFVMNEKTLEGVDLALEHGTRIRPVGFYGESSYMAFVMVSALVIFLSLELELKKVIWVLALNLVTFILLGSLAGMFAYFVVSTFYFLNSMSKNSRRGILTKFLFFGVISCIIVAGLLNSSDYAGRLTSVLTKGDIDNSIYIRYVMPVLMLSEMLDKQLFFGYSIVGFPSIDNALFYLLLHYGILAPIILLVLMLYVRTKFLLVYLILALNFNGAYFAFDKVVVMSLVVGLSIGLMRLKKWQCDERI